MHFKRQFGKESSQFGLDRKEIPLPPFFLLVHWIPVGLALLHVAGLFVYPEKEIYGNSRKSMK
jgi:hypothetical protein